VVAGLRSFGSVEGSASYPESLICEMWSFIPCRYSNRFDFKPTFQLSIPRYALLGGNPRFDGGNLCRIQPDVSAPTGERSLGYRDHGHDLGIGPTKSAEITTEFRAFPSRKCLPAPGAFVKLDG